MFLRLTEGPWGIVTAQNSQSKYQLDLKADAARGFKKKKTVWIDTSRPKKVKLIPPKKHKKTIWRTAVSLLMYVFHCVRCTFDITYICNCFPKEWFYLKIKHTVLLFHICSDKMQHRKISSFASSLTAAITCLKMSLGTLEICDVKIGSKSKKHWEPLVNTSMRSKS